MIFCLRQFLIIAREGGKHVVRHPSLHLCATYGGVDDADGHAVFCLQRTSHEVADAAHLSTVLGRNVLPRQALYVVVGTHVIELMRELQIANLVVGVVLHHVAHHVHAAADGEFHVGLSGTEEHIADKHIVHLRIQSLRRIAQRRFLCHGQRVGATCLHLRQIYLPSAIRQHLRLAGLAVQSHYHLAASQTFTPHGNLGIALQHHAVGEEFGQFQTGSLCLHHRTSH